MMISGWSRYSDVQKPPKSHEKNVSQVPDLGKVLLLQVSAVDHRGTWDTRAPGPIFFQFHAVFGGKLLK